MLVERFHVGPVPCDEQPMACKSSLLASEASLLASDAFDPTKRASLEPSRTALQRGEAETAVS